MPLWLRQFFFAASISSLCDAVQPPNGRDSSNDNGAAKHFRNATTLVIPAYEIERDDIGYPCSLIHEVSSGVCIRAELKRFPNKKDLPKYIQSLLLSENRITHLNHTLLDTFTKLRELDLSQNRISRIEKKSFQSGGLLKKVDLSYNSITRLSKGVFDGARNLLSLDLSHNAIGSIKGDAFRSLRKLNRLWLQENQITSLEPEMFNGLQGPNIEFIFLQNNKISTIEFGTFDKMTGLVVSQLSHNRLQNLSSASIQEIATYARFINWEGNPWNCDCDFAVSLDKCHNISHTFKESLPPIECRTPEASKGLLLRAVGKDCEQERQLMKQTDLQSVNEPQHLKSRKTAPVGIWSGGAIAGLFFAILFVLAILCVCFVAPYCYQKKQDLQLNDGNDGDLTSCMPPEEKEDKHSCPLNRVSLIIEEEETGVDSFFKNQNYAQTVLPNT